MTKRGRPRHPDILTPREWEVLELIREGLSNLEIGSRLGISIDGVKYHVSEILGKLELENRHDAARWTPDQRPWWESAGVLLSIPRPRFGWLSPVAAVALAVIVAIAVGLLVWALLTTRDGGLSATAVALPQGDRVAYIGADENLWLFDGTDSRRITETGTARDPAWSPDGQRLLFSHNGTLTLRDADGRLIPIDEGVVTAHWSPDSERIAYRLGTETEGPEGEVRFSTVGSVWIYDIERGEKERVVPADFDVSSLAWSPDGRRLALARYIRPHFPEDWTEPGARVAVPEEVGLYLVDIQGGEPQPVVLVGAIQQAWTDGEGREPEATRLGPLGVTGLDQIQWSPDGRFVAFQATILSASLTADGLPLLSVAIDGGLPAYHGTMLHSQALLDWFPDGHRFVFTLGGGRDVHIGKRLAIADAGFAGASVIAEEAERLPTPEDPLGEPPSFSLRSDAWPAVSPDGRQIVFQASDAAWQTVRLDVGKIEGAREGIWLANSDGTMLRQLTSDAEHLDFLPRWSSDGELIMFLRTDGRPYAGEAEGQGSSRAQLWLVHANGSGATPLITDLQRTGSYYGLFRWEDYVAWFRP